MGGNHQRLQSIVSREDNPFHLSGFCQGYRQSRGQAAGPPRREPDISVTGARSLWYFQDDPAVDQVWRQRLLFRARLALRPMVLSD